MSHREHGRCKRTSQAETISVKAIRQEKAWHVKEREAYVIVLAALSRTGGGTKAEEGVD